MKSSASWKTAVRGGDLDGSGINTAEGGSLAVGQLVHGGLSEVEAGGGVVDGQDVDGASAVAELPASSALRPGVSWLFISTRSFSNRERVGGGVNSRSQSSSRRWLRHHRRGGSGGWRPGSGSRSG